MFTYCRHKSVWQSVSVEYFGCHSVVVVNLRGHIRRESPVSRDWVINSSMLCTCSPDETGKNIYQQHLGVNCGWKTTKLE